MFWPPIPAVAFLPTAGLNVLLLRFLMTPNKRELSELPGLLLAVAAAALLMTLVIVTKSR